MANKRILIRRDTTANWQAVNPTLGSGELGIEVKPDGSRSMKAGTGSAAWNSLPYLVDSPIQLSMLVSHQNDTAAHGAASVPAAGRIAAYGASAGLKSDKIPLESNDVLRKAELDSLNSSLSGGISGLQGQIDELGGGLAGETELRENADTGIKNRLVVLEGAAALRGVAGTYAGLPAAGDWNTGDAFIVEKDETKGGVSAVYAVAAETSGTGEEDDPVVETKVWQRLAVFTVDMGGKLDKADGEDELDRAYIVTSGGGQALCAIDDASDTPDTLVRRGGSGEIKTADPAQDNDAANKKYVDDTVAEAQLATHTWLPAVPEKADLPDHETLTATLNYLCRVIADTETPANNGVWELIAGAAEWTYFSDNQDWVDALEMAAAVSAHDTDGAAHGDIRGETAGEVTRAQGAEAALGAAKQDKIPAGTSGDYLLYSGAAGEAGARSRADVPERKINNIWGWSPAGYSKWFRILGGGDASAWTQGARIRVNAATEWCDISLSFNRDSYKIFGDASDTAVITKYFKFEKVSGVFNVYFAMPASGVDISLHVTDVEGFTSWVKEADSIIGDITPVDPVTANLITPALYVNTPCRMPAWTEFTSPATSGTYAGRYSGPYDTGKTAPDGSPVKRVDWQLDGYRPSVTATAIHEAVTPAIPGIKQYNLLGIGGYYRQQAESAQPYNRPLNSDGAGASAIGLPSRFDILIAYSAFQLYSVNIGGTVPADGFRVCGWAEWHG